MSGEAWRLDFQKFFVENGHSNRPFPKNALNAFGVRKIPFVVYIKNKGRTL